MGLEVDAIDAGGDTPFALACSVGTFKSALYFLDAGAEWESML